MKIATWNINSIRARTPRVLEWLHAHQPDALCLQETKCTDEQFPFREIQDAGYRVEHFGQKSYNGVAFITKEPVRAVRRNLGDDDEQSRLLSAEYGGFRLVTVYAPNGQSVDSPAYVYKLDWYARLQRWLAATRSELPTVVCGDFNVAPADIDTWDPRLWSGQTLCTPREREAFSSLCKGTALVDLFRSKHAEPGHYSWWDYRAGAFRKNQGLRIDHLLVSPPLLERCTAVEIDRTARAAESPSDHAPVWATFTA
ncbi:MAG: exodeoxyribonuclease III [Archangium sp.]|nr:exodeoxyribonuclease III [Archangium sp.]